MAKAFNLWETMIYRLHKIFHDFSEIATSNSAFSMDNEREQTELNISCMLPLTILDKKGQ